MSKPIEISAATLGSLTITRDPASGTYVVQTRYILQATDARFAIPDAITFAADNAQAQLLTQLFDTVGALVTAKEGVPISTFPTKTEPTEQTEL